MRKKLPENEKKVKTGITIDSDVLIMLNDMILQSGSKNRSNYIEKLIKEDFEKKGKIRNEQNGLDEFLIEKINTTLDKISKYGKTFDEDED